MSFFENPTIDEPSKNSEISERSLRSYFNQENGFICRTVNPDKGSDFSAELILNKQEASNWHFAIQLKSTTNLNLVDNQKYISFTFKTSRLGYLFRELPTAGMIILYDTKTGISYFQYVRKIVDELYLEKKIEWENQEFVNIKLPIENRLDSNSITDIHSHYCSEFQKSARMKNAFGPQYGLSISGLKTSIDDFDFNNPEHIVAFLEKHGTDQLIEYDLLMISALLDKLTDRQIQQNTKILCLSAILYSETGKYDQSEIYCKKALCRKNIADDDKVSVLYASIKNQYNLNLISVWQVIQEIEELKVYPLSPQSKLTLQITQLQFRLGEFGLKNPVPDNFLEQIFKLFDQINLENISSRVKLLFTLWNADNLSAFINQIFLQDANQLLLSKSINQKVFFFKRVTDLDNQLLKILENFRGEKTSVENKLIRAYALQIWVKHILHRETILLNLNPTINHFDGFQGNLEQLINYALTAYNYFLQEGFDRDAYFALCFGLEFIELGKCLFNKSFFYDIDPLFEIKTRMEEETAIPIYNLQLQEILVKANRYGLVTNIKNLTQEQIDQIAPLITKARNSPAEFVSNIIQEIEAYREFYRRCNDANLEIHSMYKLHANSQPDYSFPVRYYLKHKLSGIISSPDFNISNLLMNWGF